MRIRDYLPSDYEAVKRIHDATEIDYSFPNINTPLFLVTKVVEDDQGIVRVCGGAYIQAEMYLWLDQSNWADPADKMAAVSALDGAVMHELYLKGVDCAVLWLPPGMDRFGERLTSELGFTKDRDGWVTYSKRLRG